jgi:dolichyl-phosphate beta-glucosyltransferase
MNPETTIVIAAYNEEERLPQTLKTIWGYLAKREVAAEVVVVDDGSTDNTAGVVRSISPGMQGLRLISYPRNKGKGFALRTGVLCSLGKKVLVTDADLSTPIEELETLERHLCEQSHHIAIGSRALPSSDIIEAQPIWRRGMSQVFNSIVKSLVIDDFKDTQCGFKLFAGDVARKLFDQVRVNRFAYDVEILALAKEHGYRVAEVPVSWKNSSASKVRPLVDSMQMLGDLVRIRIRSAERRERLRIPALEGLDSESAH